MNPHKLTAEQVLAMFNAEFRARDEDWARKKFAPFCRACEHSHTGQCNLWECINGECLLNANE